MKIVYVKWRKPVSTYAISACEALVASVNLVKKVSWVSQNITLQMDHALSYLLNSFSLIFISNHRVCVGNLTRTVRLTAQVGVMFTFAY